MASIRRGLFGLSVVSTAGCLVLVGCSPAPKPIVGVERTADGSAKVLIVPCPGYVPDQVSVAAAEGMPRWSISNVVGKGASEIEFFRVPEGWRISTDAVFDLKTTDARYIVGVMGGVGARAVNAQLAFDLDRLEALEAGEVLVRGGKTVKREDFLKPDSDRCEP
ncbi:hypothetical protein ABT144_04515 [Streptomyces sp. NPDC002039]|uniref:hypothetical protein n=1 Tax=Streptomyces sp. NPDC002039 TaxID=3154660 RepID=UPI00332646C6